MWKGKGALAKDWHYEWGMNAGSFPNVNFFMRDNKCKQCDIWVMIWILQGGIERSEGWF